MAFTVEKPNQPWKEKKKSREADTAAPQTGGAQFPAEPSAEQAAPALPQPEARQTPQYMQQLLQPEKSQAYTQAQAQLEKVRGERPVYSDAYAQKLDALYQQIVAQPDFSYNVNEDALFNQYRDQYTRGGQLAMQDTMGQAAALTGGYGSSYAQNVGQQAYNSYMQGLADVIPQLEQQAYARYRQDYADLLDQYDMLWQQSEQAYSRYQQDLDRHWQEVDYYQALADQAYQRQQTAGQLGYQLAQDAYDRAWAEKQDAYQKEQDAYDRAWAEKQDAYQKEQDAYDRAWAEKQDAYQKEQDAYDRAWAEKQDAYQKEQDAYDREWTQQQDAYTKAQTEKQDAYSKLLSALQAGYTPTEQELAAAGMTSDQARAFKSYFAAQNAPKTSGSVSSATEETEQSGKLKPVYVDFFWTFTGNHDSNGNPIFHDNKGNEVVFGKGVNPYTGTKNADIKNGTMSNGYQPNNINGTKLKNSGYRTTATGKEQNIYIANGKYWLWRGDLNRYVEVTLEEMGIEKTEEKRLPGMPR